MSETVNELDGRQYKIVVEIAGLDTEGFNGWLELSRGPIISGQYLAMLSQAVISEHRLQLPFLALHNRPFNLWLAIGSSKAYNGCYYIPLGKKITPIAIGVEKPEWDNVLVPIVPLGSDNVKNSNKNIRMLPPGWLYVYVNGHLWRELRIINELGAMRDVDLAMEAGKDERAASCHVQPHVLVPYKLNGVIVSVRLHYTAKQCSWNKLCKLGGVNSNDNRFNTTIKRKSRSTPIDKKLIKNLLQKLDLSSYQSGFNNSDGMLRIDECPNIGTTNQPNSDLLKPFRNTRIPAVFLRY